MNTLLAPRPILAALLFMLTVSSPLFPLAPTGCEVTISDGCSIEITVTGNQVFVDNTALPPGDGSSENPFPTLAAAQAASQAGSVIVVRRGDGTTRGMADGIVLEDGQCLIGEDRPQITRAAANPITLANGNVVAGVRVVGSSVACPASPDFIDASAIFGRDVADATVVDVEIAGAFCSGLLVQRARGEIVGQCSAFDTVGVAASVSADPTVGSALRVVFENNMLTEARVGGLLVTTDEDFEDTCVTEAGSLALRARSNQIELAEVPVPGGVGIEVLLGGPARGAVDVRGNRISGGASAISLTSCATADLRARVEDNPELGNADGARQPFGTVPEPGRERGGRADQTVVFAQAFDDATLGVAVENNIITQRREQRAVYAMASSTARMGAVVARNQVSGASVGVEILATESSRVITRVSDNTITGFSVRGVVIETGDDQGFPAPSALGAGVWRNSLTAADSAQGAISVTAGDGNVCVAMAHNRADAAIELIADPAGTGALLAEPVIDNLPPPFLDPMAIAVPQGACGGPIFNDDFETRDTVPWSATLSGGRQHGSQCFGSRLEGFSRPQRDCARAVLQAHPR